MSSTKSHSVPTPESIHDAWLSQRAELERDLFDGWTDAASTIPTVAPQQVVTVAPQQVVTDPPRGADVQISSACVEQAEPKRVDHDSPVESITTDQSRHQLWLKESNAAAVQQRVDHQLRVTDALSQQREAFFQDLSRQRAAFEQELATRESEWAMQRDQEWAALRSAKEVHEVAQQRLKGELATQRVHEREELMQWRRQAEAELAEARRLFEQDRLQQHQEFVRQRETEMTRIAREREELEARVRNVQSELAFARQRQDDELRQARHTQSAQMRAERAELDKLRETLVERFRREQIVLENGVQIFGQHLSRVTEELRLAQRGVPAASEFATESHPAELLADPCSAPVQVEPLEPTILSLDEIRERLNGLKQPQRAAA